MAKSGPHRYRKDMTAIPHTTIGALMESHDALLLDAYGVLVNYEGPLPGARDMIRRLNHAQKPYLVVSNSASRTAERAAAGFQAFGLDITPERILSAGGLLTSYFQECSLQGAACRVLGTGDSRTLVTQAGGQVVGDTDDFDVLVLADQAFEPFWEVFDRTMSRLFKLLESGRQVHLILPNPDLIYPREFGFGVTSGGLAELLEAILERRFPEHPEWRFVRLGKPEPRIFRAAAARMGDGTLIMIGDQLETDILGAQRFGIDSALLLGGVSVSPQGVGISPTYLLHTLAG